MYGAGRPLIDFGVRSLNEIVKEIIILTTQNYGVNLFRNY